MRDTLGATHKHIWIAALLEGEGSFIIGWKTSTTNGTYPYFAITCNMTDEDVIRRLHQWTGVGYLRGPFPQKNPKHKPFWRWHVYRREEVYRLCKTILPYMGARRSKRIAEIISLFESSGRPVWRHGTRQGYEFHKCKCDLCRAANARRHRMRRQRIKSSVSLSLHNTFRAS